MMNYDDIDLKWQNMMDGILAQVQFVKNTPQAIYEKIKTTLALKGVPKRVYLVGCGDSWYCGMATRLAFEEWAGIPTEALQALEFSRYYVRFAPENSLVVAVSNSGRVSRTIEAVLQAKKHGLVTIGVTSNLKDGLSQAADHTIDLAYTERRFGPGTSSYMASMIVQYCLALYLGWLSGNLDGIQVASLLDQISGLSEPMQKTIDANLVLLEKLAKQVKVTDPVTFIGGGPNYGTAFFCMAKVIEATRAGAVGQELEEWAHEQFFSAGPRSVTFLLAQPGACIDRAREQIHAIKEMGSLCVAVCDADDFETTTLADFIAPVYGKYSEILSPILYCVPVEIFAFHLAVINKLTMLGFDDPHIKDVNWNQIFNSKLAE
jgi:glutamine---fructose-6-phosphate transaminase (isomerizing)